MTVPACVLAASMLGLHIRPCPIAAPAKAAPESHAQQLKVPTAWTAHSLNVHLRPSLNCSCLWQIQQELAPLHHTYCAPLLQCFSSTLCTPLECDLPQFLQACLVVQIFMLFLVHAYSTRIWKPSVVDDSTNPSAAAIEHGFQSPEGHSKLIMDGPWVLLWPCLLLWPCFEGIIGYGFIHNGIGKELLVFMFLMIIIIVKTLCSS